MNDHRAKHTPDGGRVLGKIGGIPIVAYPDQQPAAKSKGALDKMSAMADTSSHGNICAISGPFKR